jgi:hypothetical protein
MVSLGHIGVGEGAWKSWYNLLVLLLVLLGVASSSGDLLLAGSMVVEDLVRPNSEKGKGSVATPIRGALGWEAWAEDLRRCDV